MECDDDKPYENIACSYYQLGKLSEMTGDLETALSFYINSLEYYQLQDETESNLDIS